MLGRILFPQMLTLDVMDVEVGTQELTIHVRSTTDSAVCPQCQVASDRCHSHYHRYPADLPCIGKRMRLNIHVRRFFCGDSHCSKRTFAEQFPALLAPRARRTARLAASLEPIAFEVSAESGSRILSWLGISASPDMLIKLVRTAAEAKVTTPRVLGVDDWAKRKGQSYGTILIDLEAHQVVDVLPEQSAGVLATWLREHPGVAVISRDRGTEYIRGATEGAPDALQVADRWHLLLNLREAVEKLMVEKPACLLAAAEPPESARPESPTEETTEPVEMASVKETRATADEPPPLLTRAEAQKVARHARKQGRFELVCTLHEEGLSNREIGRQMKMSTRTIGKYLSTGSCPFYPEGVQRGSKLDKFRDFLDERWRAGCHNATQLWREIRQQGFDGSRGLVAQWAARERQWLPKVSKNGKRSSSPPRPKKVIPWSAGRAAWLLVKVEADLDEEEQAALERIKQADEAVALAHQLTHSFQRMVRERQVEQLQPWLDQVMDSGMEALVSFANGITRDFDAVKNALSLPWSNGQTEGHVNRLKFIKRQMFGRAKFDLLRRRVLGYPAGRCSPAFT